MMRNTETDTPRATPAARSQTRNIIIAPLVLIAVLGVSVWYFTRPSYTQPGGVQTSAPTKPSGTVTSSPPTTESWTVAKGLPNSITRFTFSAADPTRGYAAAFVNKQSQLLYTTVDSGTTWHQAGTVQGPVGDIVATDPRDPQDVVMLSVYAPTPGTYTFQRSEDGGQTWAVQSTDLPTTGQVALTGWSDSTFLVGFQLDGSLSAVVAFPKGQKSLHLDVQRKVNGIAIPHLHLITGYHNTIKVWGSDDAPTQHIIALATNDLGKSWAALPNTILGNASVPVAATDDGATMFAASADEKHFALSGDGGATWAAQPNFADAPLNAQNVLVTPDGKTVAVALSQGTSVLRNGTWSKLTSKQASYISVSGSQHPTRLWASDDTGHIIWYDA